MGNFPPVKLQNLSAVVADDHRMSREIVSEILRTAGMRDIRFADDGAAALNLIFARTPDFLVLDFEMPHDGVTTLRQIRQRTHGVQRRLPVIMMTASATRSRVEIMRDAGATEIISKPLTNAKLLGRIHAIILHPREFIESSTYMGPERRRMHAQPYHGPRRRLSDQTGNVLEL